MMGSPGFFEPLVPTLSIEQQTLDVLKRSEKLLQIIANNTSRPEEAHGGRVQTLTLRKKRK